MRVAAALPTGMRRTVLVRPGMCGHNSLLAGQIGDWTWDTVGAVSGTDVLCARDAAGAPTYLAFYYYRIRGSARFHLRTPSFGDRLHVTSTVYGAGAESVLTRHRIARTPAGGTVADPDCLRVENVNRWVSRGADGSNAELVRSSPPGFRHADLPAVPDRHSPRLACQLARTRLTFLAPDDDRYAAEDRVVHVDQPVDLTRDLNGVGLLYFASYFGFVDHALLALWRALGRDDRSFLERVVVDQQLCYLGNADAGSVISAVAARRRGPTPADEAVDVVLRDRDTTRLLAVCTLRLGAGRTA